MALHAKLRELLPARCFPEPLGAPFEARVPLVLPTLASTLLLLVGVAVLYLHFGAPRSRYEGRDISVLLGLFPLVGLGWLATKLPLRVRVSDMAISIRYAIGTRVLLVTDLTRVDLTGGTRTAPQQVLKLATRRARVTLRDGELNLPVEELHDAIVRLRARAVNGPRPPFASFRQLQDGGRENAGRSCSPLPRVEARRVPPREQERASRWETATRHRGRASACGRRRARQANAL